MDCCNYMQYRHHQPYYGSQYYEPLPQYHGDFYGQPMYQDYYGSPPYYPQQWPCAGSFPDYVYNPKEARIRKAMRDATRDRSIGASPMLPRPSARRMSHTWVSPHEDIMMNPMANVRGGAMEAPVCNFPLASAGANQFMSQMNGYTKLEPPMPPASSMHSNYMQSNPLAQLQQHTEMWHDYQTMRPRSGNPFLMPDVPAYQPPQMPAAMHAQIAAPTGTPPPNENVPPDDGVDKPAEFKGLEAAPDAFISVYEPGEPSFDKINDGNDKIKKSTAAAGGGRKPASKPLPDFNEAFGTTERGRFQSPPDPRLAPNKGYLDYFFDINPVKFDDYQI